MDQEDQIAHETHTLLDRFNPSLVFDVTTSQPRDCLQSERTTLSFIRFASTLAFASVALILNVRFDTSVTSDDPKQDHDKRDVFSTVLSSVLIVLSLSTLIISGINYIKTIKHYANNKIRTYNATPMAVLISCVVFVLLAINISLLVNAYSE